MTREKIQLTIEDLEEIQEILNQAHIGGKMAGSKFRYDLPTKAKCVDILMNTKSTIEINALFYDVAEITIRAWVHNYLESYEEYMALNPGVMTVSKTLITDVDNVNEAKALLSVQEDAREELNSRIGTRFYQERSKLTPEILDIITGNKER